MIAGRDGVVLEIGLGNGRTFDHLRDTLPDRKIFVFDRHVAAHPNSTPANDRLFLGDIDETLARAADALPEPAVLVHSDVGTGDDERDARVAEMMAEMLPRLLDPGAVVVSDQDIPLPDAVDLPLPDGVQPGRYFFRTYMGEEMRARRVAGVKG